MTGHRQAYSTGRVTAPRAADIVHMYSKDITAVTAESQIDLDNENKIIMNPVSRSSAKKQYRIA